MFGFEIQVASAAQIASVVARYMSVSFVLGSVGSVGAFLQAYKPRIRMAEDSGLKTGRNMKYLITFVTCELFVFGSCIT